MRFDCFGSRCGVWGRRGAEADRRRAPQLEAWHVRFSRFRADSELSRLNADPRAVVPVSTTMARLLRAVREAASRDRRARRRRRSRARSRPRATAPTSARRCRCALALRARPAAPARAPAAAAGVRRSALDGWAWSRAPARARVRQRRARQGPVRRPDRRAAAAASFAVDCGGDLRFGGRRRRLEVADPFGGAPLHVSSSATAPSPPAGSAGAAGSTPTAAPPTTCSTPRPAGPRSPASSRPPRSPRPRSRPSGAPRPRCSAGRTARDWLAHGGVVVLDDGIARPTDHRIARRVDAAATGQR